MVSEGLTVAEKAAEKLEIRIRVSPCIQNIASYLGIALAIP